MQYGDGDGVHTLYLHTLRHMSAAMKLYEKLGFVVTTITTIGRSSGVASSSATKRAFDIVQMRRFNGAEDPRL